MTEPKILIWDVETAPILSNVWALKADYINYDMMIESTFMLTWAAKWHGQQQVFSARLNSAEALARDDKGLVAPLIDLYNEADFTVAHNGDRFDVPILRTRALVNGLPNLAPVTQIDTLKWARSGFKFASNRLDYLAQHLGVGEKAHTGGWSLWERCLEGDEKALRKMERYNRRDIRILEGVFDRLLPYAKNVPALSFTQEGCPVCGSYNMTRQGYRRTNVCRYQRWKCEDCGRWSQTRLADNTVKPLRKPL